jgi:branched-chain amino acid transport system ATP-binding protein
VTAPALELIEVHAAYGRIEVLRGVSLVVPDGSVFALLGPNGAGKTTTLRVASGRMEPIKGCLHVGGNHVNGASPAELARAGVCTIPEGKGIFPNLTVEENLVVATHTGTPRDELIERSFSAFPALADRRRQLAGTLSGGEQQMLSIARAMSTDPSVLMLDEISMGLAPLIVADLYERVAQLVESGVTILIVEQFARLVLGICDYAAVMTQGRIRYMGEPADVEAALSEAYLGGAA